MKLPRRNFLHLAASAAALPAVSRIAWAQAYPARPVRIIVGFPPGGPSDILARLIGQRLSERLGQPFIIENRPGATGNIATEAVARAPADGHTLLWVVPGYGIAAPRGTPPAIVEKLNQAVNAVLADPKLQTRLAELAGEPMPMTPAEFGKLVAEETDKWGKVIRAANIKPE